MKVVLFCGGLGMRLREYSENVPKPMVPIGYRPVLWHVMKYYAYYGHKEFIVCLGYKADEIKKYFLNYNECLSNDFTLSDGGKTLHLLTKDLHDWKITFVDTGLSSNIGQRLKAVRKYLEGEQVFLANYSDGLTDFPLTKLTDNFSQQKTVAAFLCVKPYHSFDVVSSTSDHRVAKIERIGDSGIWINGGYFVFTNKIFNYIKDEEDLVGRPFERLIDEKQLTTYKYDGFWACMDTFKDKQQLDDMYSRGEAPWELWKEGANTNSNLLVLHSGKSRDA